MKYYKIGKVSKLFGVSCETIRNYEKTGLIRSTTPPDSSVRYYDIDNVRKLVGIRTMRNQGFSVSELEQVYSDMSLEEYDELMRQKIAADECELRRGGGSHARAQRQNAGGADALSWRLLSALSRK